MLIEVPPLYRVKHVLSIPSLHQSQPHTCGLTVLTMGLLYRKVEIDEERVAKVYCDVYSLPESIIKYNLPLNKLDRFPETGAMPQLLFSTADTLYRKYDITWQVENVRLSNPKQILQDIIKYISENRPVAFPKPDPNDSVKGHFVLINGYDLESGCFFYNEPTFVQDGWWPRPLRKILFRRTASSETDQSVMFNDFISWCRALVERVDFEEIAFTL